MSFNGISAVDFVKYHWAGFTIQRIKSFHIYNQRRLFQQREEGKKGKKKNKCESREREREKCWTWHIFNDSNLVRVL